jgi:hypothetical protein
MTGDRKLTFIVVMRSRLVSAVAAGFRRRMLLAGLMVGLSVLGCRSTDQQNPQRERVHSYFNDVLVHEIDRQRSWNSFSDAGGFDRQAYESRLETMRRNVEQDFRTDLKNWETQEAMRKRHLDSLLKDPPMDATGRFRKLVE